jgi:hypothetical protein
MMSICLIAINVLTFFIMRNIDPALAYKKFDESEDEIETNEK